MDGVLCSLGVVTEWYSPDMSGISDTGIPNLVASMSLRCLTLNCSVFWEDWGVDALVSNRPSRAFMCCARGCWT